MEILRAEIRSKVDLTSEDASQRTPLDEALEAGSMAASKDHHGKMM